MKKDIIAAVGLGISVFIGLCIAYLLKGGDIDIIISLTGGVVAAAVHYVFSLVRKRK